MAADMRLRFSRTGRERAIDIAADQPQHFRRCIRKRRAIGRNLAGKHIVDDDGRDCGRKAKRGREQRFGDARRDNRQICRVGFRDADEAVHDAPHRAEKPDEGRGRPDGGENAGAAADRDG